MDKKDEQSNQEIPFEYEEEQSFFSRIPKIVFIVGGIIVFLIVLFLVVSFVSSFFSKEKSQEVTLTYWGLWEDESVMRGILNDFERQNPSIKVQYSKRDPKLYRETVITRIQNGGGPDVFRFHNSWIPMLDSYLLPLSSSVITKSELEKEYVATVSKDVVANGAIYGIPMGIDTLALFVNSELLQAQGISAPKTWEEFLSTARKLTVVDPQTGKIVTAGAAMGGYDNITYAPDIVSLLLVQNGASLHNLQSTVQNASDALDFYSLFGRGENKVWDETLPPSRIAFANGNLGMYFGYSWDVFMIQAMAPSNFKFEVYPVPSLPGRKQTIASYWIEGISVKTTHQKEAGLLLKFLSQKQTQQKLFSESSKKRFFGIPYVQKELIPLLKENKMVYPFASQADHAVSSYFVDQTQDTNGLNERMNSYLGNAVRSVISGGSSAQSAIETLSSGVSQVLSQYSDIK